MPQPLRKLAQPIELMSFTAGKADDDTPIVLITLRPFPASSPRSKLVAITREQAQRAHNDLAVVLADDEEW